MQRNVLDYPMHLNAPIDPRDRYPYGWRYVPETLSDGSEHLVKSPLTLEDILHPQEEDFRLHSHPHTQDVHYCSMVFESMLNTDLGEHVLSDCRVAWDEAGKYAHGPDVAVIFNVKAYGRWSTFNTIKEGTRPSLIVEVTSPTTRSTDLFNKVWEYAEQKVPRYVIADARESPDSRKVRLIDYRLNEEGEYETQPLGPNGRIWLEEVRLWLAAEEGWLVCYDAEGNRKETYTELDQALRSEKHARTELDQALRSEKLARTELDQDLRSERQAREALEARLKELEARLKAPNT